MRDFYKEMLFKKLPVNYGIKFYSSMSDSDLIMLLDGLEDISKQFQNIIPYDLQKKLIEEAVIKADKFTGLDVRFVYKALQGYKESRTALHVSKQHKQEGEEERRNKEFYTKQLQQKKKENPNYDPIEEYKKQMENSELKKAVAGSRWKKFYKE